MARLPPELRPAGRGKPAPRMTTDRAAFFPTVLRNDRFRRDGLLFGFELVGGKPVHWAVVDPNRHTMYVWEKRSVSFVRSALDLDASLFCNGPFTDYADGDLARTTSRFVRDAVPCMLDALAGPDRRRLQPDLRDVAVRHFQATTPLGFVLGAREGIRETSTSRPKVFHFGRQGPDFGDYRIGRGDPHLLTEAIGGLFGGVSGYEPYTVDRLIRVGYWGLAPLHDDLELRRSGIDLAREMYRASTGRGCDGLVIVVAGWGSTQRLSRLLSAIRVKDAVQIDGGDSLLLGGGRTLRQGALMPEWKRLLQRWGLQFRPREPTD